MKNSFILPDVLKQAIYQAVKRVVGEGVVTEEEIILEHPAEESFGDYSSNIALILAKRVKKNPLDLAKSIAAELKQEVIKVDQNISVGKKGYFSSLVGKSIERLVDRIEVAPPGFLNLWLSKDYLSTELCEVLNIDKAAKSSSFVKSQDKQTIILMKGQFLQGNTIMVEYAHPNTHKAFHIGHLRNISTGEALVRILEANGAEVIRVNYQGDVGMHIAKCLYGILQSSKFKVQSSKLKTIREKVEYLGKMYAAGSKAYEENPVAKKEIEQINSKIYQKDSTIEPLWKETRQWSLDYFDTIYQRLGTHYDRFYFESEVVAGADIAKEAVKKGVLKEDKGAVIFDGTPYGLDKRVFINSLGLPTYEAKELKLAEMEFSEFGKLDRLIHVVGPEQSSFFRVTFKVEELLGIQKDQQYHLAYGWVRLKKGKMSSRLGNVVLGEWLLDEAKKKIFDIVRNNKLYSDGEKEDIAEKTAVAAVKYSFLKVSPQREIAFDLDESISFEGDSGPYLLYTYARCRSVLRRAGLSPKSLKLPRSLRGDRAINPEEYSLLRTFVRFPDVVTTAGKNYAPNLIAGYLFDLAQKFNLFYGKHEILGESQPFDPAQDKQLTTSFRLALTAATAHILKQGLYLLGIETVERM